MSDRLDPYCGPAPAPGALWQSWNLDPPLLAGLAVLSGLILWRAGRAQRVPGLIAVAALVVAFVSPLCAMTVALFSVRSAHHLLLITLAAPALAVAWPILARRLPAGLSLAVLSGVMVAWHVPAIYEAIWRSDGLYWLMQAAMILPAWAFWSAVLAPRPAGDEALRRAVLIGGLAGIMGFLGAILTFAPAILYFPHVEGAVAWGIDPLVDQQLAGLVMWVPGFLPVAAIAAGMLWQGWRRSFAA